MKSTLKLFSLFLVAAFVFASCSKDDNPVDNSVFIGTYKGSVGYKDEKKSISKADGSVTVTKVGDRYDFVFSDGIPSINNLKMSKNDGTYFEFSADSYSGLIKINAKNLNIAVSKDDSNWTANVNR